MHTVVFLLDFGLADCQEVAPIVWILTYAEIHLDVCLEIVQIIHGQALWVDNTRISEGKCGMAPF